MQRRSVRCWNRDSRPPRAATARRRSCRHCPECPRLWPRRTLCVARFGDGRLMRRCRARRGRRLGRRCRGLRRSGRVRRRTGRADAGHWAGNGTLRRAAPRVRARGRLMRNGRTLGSACTGRSVWRRVAALGAGGLPVARSRSWDRPRQQRRRCEMGNRAPAAALA